MRRIALNGSFSAALILTLSTACQRPVPTSQPTAMVVDEKELDSLWDASLNVLRKFDFQPDRQDKAMGVIVTLPTTTMQWGEFWRQDVADGYSYAEASMHTTQRQVTVRFPRNGERKIDVQVDVYRLSMPESQITTSSSAIQAFSGVLPDTQGNFPGLGRTQKSWILLGRDPALEERLIKRIVTEAGVTGDIVPDANATEEVVTEASPIGE